MTRLATILLVGLMTGPLALPTDAQTVRPRELNMQYHRARAAWESGSSLLEAKARVDRVLEELPGDPEARMLRARILLDMDRPEAALSDARRAVETLPGSGEAQLVLCEAAARTGNDDEAATAMRRSADQIMNDVGAYVRLSECARRLGELTEAEAFARLAIAQGTMNPAGHLQLARVFVQMGARDKAITTLARGLENEVVRPSVVLQDPVLRELAGDERLAGLLR